MTYAANLNQYRRQVYRIHWELVNIRLNSLLIFFFLLDAKTPRKKTPLFCTLIPEGGGMIGVITRGDKQTAKIYQVSIETTRLPWVTECVELGSILMSRPIQYTFF